MLYGYVRQCGEVLLVLGDMYVSIFVTKVYMIQMKEEKKNWNKKVGMREICIKRKEECDTQETLLYVGRIG